MKTLPAKLTLPEESRKSLVELRTALADKLAVFTTAADELERLQTKIAEMDQAIEQGDKSVDFENVEAVRRQSDLRGQRGVLSRAIAHRQNLMADEASAIELVKSVSLVVARSVRPVKEEIFALVREQLAPFFTVDTALDAAVRNVEAVSQVDQLGFDAGFALIGPTPNALKQAIACVDKILANEFGWPFKPAQ